MNLHSCGLFLCMLHYFQFVFHIWYTLILGKSPVFIFPCLIQLARGKVKCSASLPRIAIVSQFDFSSLCWFMFDLGKFFNFPFDSLGHFKDVWNFLSTCSYYIWSVLGTCGIYFITCMHIPNAQEYNILHKLFVADKRVLKEIPGFSLWNLSWKNNVQIH